MDCSTATCGGDTWLDCYGKGMTNSRRSPFLHPVHVLHEQESKLETPQQRSYAEGYGMRFDCVARGQSANSTVLHIDSGTRILTGDLKPTACRSLRPHSTPATLMWLDENYEVADGVCIPRSTLYMHYVDFCAKNSMQPVNAASFGKIIRQQFPQLTTRRLGTRGQSRYHYYGIAIRETSPYFQFTFSKKGATSYEARKDVAKQISLFIPRMKTGAVLPDFPSIKDLNLPPSADIEKMTTFLMMYRTHCQRLLDTVIRASFDEVQNFVLHFWQGMPSHLSSILDTNVLVNLVGVCDCILYRTICAALLPSMLHTLPDGLTKVVKKFMQELEGWLKVAMCHLPENIRHVKLEMASRFARMLRRQMSLNHLAQASRMVLNNADIARQMLSDWRQVDLDAICRETLYSTTGTSGEHQPHDPTSCEALRRLVKDFESLLEEAVSIDSYVEWLESLVNKCVIVPKSRRKCSRRMASQFLLIWSAFGTRVIRDMTLHSAASFGSFHLLRLMFDDYVLFLVETIHTEDQMKDFLINISNDSAPCFQMEATVPGYFSESCNLNVEQRGCSAETPVPDGYNCGPEPAAISPPAQEVPSSSINATYESPDNEEQYACTWMPGEYYQSLYQDVQYENRRSWPSTTVFSRPENKPYNYQQSTQYLIVSQDASATRADRESLFTGPESGCVYGSHFSNDNKTEEAISNCNHPETSNTPAIMYTASGAIYQSYTVVASPPEKGPDTCREKDRSRVHHVTLRMDGALYCNT